MIAYYTPSGRVFHSGLTCPKLGPVPLELPIEPDSTIASVAGRRLHRCHHCWPVDGTELGVITIDAACRIMGISTYQGKKLANAGQFPGAFKFGNAGWWRVRVAALTQFLEAGVNG